MADVKTQIQEASAKNKALLEILAQTDHAPPALQQQKSFLVDLKTELERTNKNLKLFEVKRKNELDDHEKYRDSHVRRFMFKATGQSAKFAQRAEKEEQEYFEALRKLHEEEQIQASLEARVRDTEKALRELEDLTATHRNAQQQLDDLYFGIFTGPTPQFPGDDELEDRSNRTLQAYHDTKVRSEGEARVVKLLTEAANLMKASLRHMEDALSASRFDMFGGDSLADAMERNALSKAERAVQEAKMLFLQAQNASNQVASFPTVRFVETSVFGDVLFDNIFSDMAFHEKLKDGRSEFQRIATWVNAQVGNAKSREQAVAQDLRQKEKDLEQARIDLQKSRERAFEAVANGQVA